MSKSAVVLCLNGRRKTVKFNPNTTVSQILEDLCAKEKLDSTLYELRTQKGILLDKSLPWRYTNLPNNAKLELHKSANDSAESPHEVRIALQLHDGRRLTGEFSTATLLSEILNHFKTEIESTLPPDGDSIPAVTYMRQNLVGNDVISATSLRVLGIVKGSALLRFSYQAAEVKGEAVNVTRKPSSEIEKQKEEDMTNAAEEKKDIIANVTNKPDITIPPLEEETRRTFNENANTAVPIVPVASDSSIHVNNASSPQVQPANIEFDNSSEKSTNRESSASSGIKIVESDSLPYKRAKLSEDVTTSAEHDLSTFKFPAETKGENLYRSSTLIRDEEDLSKPCARLPKIFNERGATENTNSQSEVPDEFFEITVDDVRKMMADLKHERQKYDEKDMLTEEQRKNRKFQLVSRYPKVIIRILFPERIVLQGVFTPLEKVENLYQFVQGHVKHSSFYLFTSPPKNILKNKDLTLYDCNLAPASKIYFGSKENMELGNLLKESSLDLLCTLEEANQDLYRLKETQ